MMTTKFGRLLDFPTYLQATKIRRRSWGKWNQQEEEHENNVMLINQKINVIRVKGHDAWESWKQEEEEHEKYVVPRNQKTTSRRRRGTKFISHSNLTNLGKLKFSWSSKNLEHHEA